MIWKLTMKKFTLVYLLGFLAYFCNFSLCGAGMELPINQLWWNYSSGAEFPGATGSLSWPSKGSLRLDGNFTKGGDYVMALLRGHFSLPALKSISFEFLTNGNAVTFRVQDGAGKMHQYQLPVRQTSDWQTVTLPLTYSACSWGGPNEKRFTPGVQFIGCLVRKPTSVKNNSSFLEIRRIILTPANESESGHAGHWLPPVFNPDDLLVEPGSILTVPIIGQDGKVRYTLLDYNDKIVSKGELNCKGSQIQLKVPDTEGYFELLTAGGVVSFITAKRRSSKADPYWGVDESFTWWGEGGNFRPGYMRFLVRSGICWGRDRIRWNDLQPTQDSMKFEAYEQALDWSKEAGLNVLDVFHDTPAWNKRLLSENDNFMVSPTSKKGYSYGSNVYPRNYIATSKSWREICSHYTAIKAMEVWNEPDIGFGNDFPAEFFIALTKNFSTTFRLAGIDTKVIGGVLAIPQETTPYYNNLIKGNLLDDCDAFSFHTYRSPLDMEEQIWLLRKQEKEAGRTPGFPFWITESGRPWPSGPPRPPVNQGKFSAQEIVGKAIECKVLGVEKYFPFVIIWHVETIFNFSMFDQKHTPLRSISAYVTAVQILSHMKYIGDINLPGSDRCRVFSDGKTAVCWVYKSFMRKIAGDWGSLDTEAHKHVHIPLPNGLNVKKILGADGRKLKLKKGELPMDDGYCYLIFDAKEVKRHLNTKTRAMTLYEMAKSYIPAERTAKDVVIQPDYDPSLHKYNRDGVFLKDNEELDLWVIYNNLSTIPVEIQPVIKQVPPGIIVETKQMPEMELAPQSMKRFLFKIRGTSKLPMREVELLEVADQCGNATSMMVAIGGDRKIPPLEVMPLNKMKQATFTKLQGKKDWNSFSGQWMGQVEPDISAAFRFGYDKRNLYLDVRIKDKEHSCKFDPFMAWLGDSVQVALAYGSRQIELCASHGVQGDKVYRHVGDPTGLVDKIGFKWKRNDRKQITYYNLTIPAGELGISEFKPGMHVPCTLLLNSGGPDGRHGFLTWGDGIRGSKKISEFNELVLK